MTTEDTEYVKEMFNQEITKLRKEVYDLSESILIGEFCPNDYERAWIYFKAVPIMNSLNRESLEMLVECCLMAKQYREDKDK